MTTFKVMTWNLENLFQPNLNDAEQSRKYQEKLQSLSQLIKNLAADVIGVQEVGSPESFEDLINQLNGQYPYSQLSTQSDRRGIRVGFSLITH
ncbi:endonuclease/exonuclease/phosphatase family protein [Crocosphaera chwakensis]|uniref:Endonuclease/exonuclease/phosphatase domain-containing protein n=1 Tax=Crocosphaera chwakensis CCY0110 TaxID=391612 RepID=A3IWT8_9CHRO|nr:endonuclease/exonuclease/phosphatase family protein [Crocosphaera chwakensis]EAZ89040.1 hypothetical protein CY0110_01315 [Crocosphaera chwakensis CCY0110]